jgi:hypothetical protein
MFVIPKRDVSENIDEDKEEYFSMRWFHIMQEYPNEYKSKSLKLLILGMYKRYTKDFHQSIIHDRESFVNLFQKAIIWPQPKEEEIYHFPEKLKHTLKLFDEFPLRYKGLYNTIVPKDVVNLMEYGIIRNENQTEKETETLFFTNLFHRINPSTQQSEGYTFKLFEDNHLIPKQKECFKEISSIPFDDYRSRNQFVSQFSSFFWSNTSWCSLSTLTIAGFEREVAHMNEQNLRALKKTRPPYSFVFENATKKDLTMNDVDRLNFIKENPLLRSWVLTGDLLDNLLDIDTTNYAENLTLENVQWKGIKMERNLLTLNVYEPILLRMLLKFVSLYQLFRYKDTNVDKIQLVEDIKSTNIKFVKTKELNCDITKDIEMNRQVSVPHGSGHGDTQVNRTYDFECLTKWMLNPGVWNNVLKSTQD